MHLPTASAHMLLETAAAAGLVLEARPGNKILYQSQAVRSKQQSEGRGLAVECHPTAGDDPHPQLRGQ